MTRRRAYLSIWLRGSAFILPLSACAAPRALTEASPGIEPYEVSCDAGRAKSLIGSKHSPQAAAKALRLSGAVSVRWIGPGDSVTSDFVTGRINLETDRAGLIISVRCE
jgi:hypothetical protein